MSPGEGAGQHCEVSFACVADGCFHLQAIIRCQAASSNPSAEGEAPAELVKIVKAFQMVSPAGSGHQVLHCAVQAATKATRGACFQVRDPKAKYQQLMFYAKKLPPMAKELHTEGNKVRGCVSQVRNLMCDAS